MSLNINNASSINFWDDNPTEFVKTDSPTLNEIFNGGLRTSNFVVIQAPSGAGKTTLLLRLALRALMAGKKVLYVSIGEQTEKEIYAKMACMKAKVEYKGNSIKEYSKEDAELIMESASNKIFDNLYLNYDDNNVFASLRNQALQLGITYIFIDYLGCCMPPDGETQYTNLNEIAAAWKNWACENNLCVVTAMQTTRGIYDELKNNVKEMKDLQYINESFMADSIGPARKCTIGMTFCRWNENPYLIVWKNRLNGKLAVIQLNLRKDSYEWEEMFNPKEGF